MPPIASISLTMWPFPIPPIAGLHDISPILFLSIVINSTWAPVLAAALAASTPACPPPITIISVSFIASRSVVLTTGTFLNGTIHIGNKKN